MQLIEINAVQAQPAQAALAGGSQVLRRSVLNPLVGTRPIKTALGGDYEVGRIGMQSLGDDCFTHVRTVGVGGINEIDAQFDGAPQNSG
jgi:hypothetical protein